MVNAKFFVYIPDFQIRNTYEKLINKEMWLEAKIIIKNLSIVFPKNKRYKTVLQLLNNKIK